MQPDPDARPHPPAAQAPPETPPNAVASRPVRTLAIDLGTRRVGLALSDEGGTWASPLEVLEVNGADQALAAVGRVLEREGVRQVVIGLPLNMDDSVGPAAREAVRWAGRLAQSLPPAPAIAIVFVDERLSSFAAEQTILRRKRGGEKITRKGKKKQLDALAAVEFLQAYLDGRLAAIVV